MKIDPLDHVTALDKAIGKTKLLKVGMSGSETSAFAIKYVLKKSFNVDASQINFTVPHASHFNYPNLMYYYCSCYLNISMPYKTLSMSFTDNKPHADCGAGRKNNKNAGR
jgi:hypothetical protein